MATSVFREGKRVGKRGAENRVIEPTEGTDGKRRKTTPLLNCKSQTGGTSVAQGVIEASGGEGAVGGKPLHRTRKAPPCHLWCHLLI